MILKEGRISMQNHQNEGKEKGFLLSLSLTTITFFFELIGGIWSGSLALISDSAHVFLDVFALGISYLALKVSSKPADDTHSYGFHRMEVLAALLNGLTLLIISVGIFYEAYERWNNPAQIKPLSMLWIAVVGLIVNILVAFVLHGHQHEHASHSEHDHDHAPEARDLNVHSAYLHVIGDAISSVGVILAAVLIYFTHWSWLDPLMSVIIGFIILFGSFRILKSSLHILVEGVPEGIDYKDVIQSIQSVGGVKGLHDLHIWNICSGNIALSAHVMVEAETPVSSDEIIHSLDNILLEKYRINHTTIQIEQTPCIHPCCE
jgi:cobalt-zinc-cadmium efflux system protein